MEKLQNIGPRISQLLENINVTTRAELLRRTPTKVYEELINHGYPRNLMLLYALVGAANEEPWQVSRTRFLLSKSQQIRTKKT